MRNMQESITQLSLEELITFVAVAERSSFSEAARDIGRDPTQVSRRISQLEKTLGVRLLSRTTRRVALTEAGALYYQRVRGVLDELESAGVEAGNLASKPQGLLRVSLPITFGRQWIAPLLPAFLKEHPQIRIEAVFSDRYADLVAEGFDVAIRVGAQRDSSLTAKLIAPFTSALFASPEYAQAHGLPSHPSELTEHACLGFTSHASWPEWILTKDGARHSFRPNGPLNTDNSEALLLAAHQGLGIILTPDWLAAGGVREGKLLRVLDGWRSSSNGGVYAIMPPGRLVPAKTRLFVDEISASIQAAWLQP
ncbi:LysR family transcriptional regulator [Pseudomonas taiwanensis]|uniref:LysR family transcriptional regulator n=1 Tax=Pseudomonas taiwanensis TaxID=470150 RepID=A0ABR6V3I7_9PSED|nr:LysR family transcriptional regulator [Pseudomonas taiwanensis]MBC3474998.1 LysR family transcriptional regulator [Pseudomonas taiwanensis]